MRIITNQRKHQRKLTAIYDPAEKVTRHKNRPTRYYKRDDAKLYLHHRWRQMRAVKLAGKPVCELCQERLATDLDHIRAHQGDKSLFFNLANTQAVCKPCHQAKTAAERDARKRVILKPRG